MRRRAHPVRLRTTFGLAIAAAGLVLSLPACSGSESRGDAPADVTSADAAPAPGEEAAEQALAEDRVAIDVRTADEFDAGHVEGARLISLQSESFADDIASLDADGEYVVYCRSGNRSAQAAEQMREIGLDVVDGGALTDMEAAGWPTTS